MIGRGSGGIAAVIRRDQRQIAGREPLEKSGQPPIELFERARITLDIIAMAVLLIEIHQIDEDQAAGDGLHRGERLLHTVAIVLGVDMIADAVPAEDVENLPYAINRDATVFQAVEQHAARRWYGV